MSTKPNPKPTKRFDNREVVEDFPQNDELQQFAQNSVQRALHRLTYPFRRVPDADDPGTKARTAANEILDEADAMLNDLFDKYRSRLNVADAEDSTETAPQPSYRPAAWITRMNETNTSIHNAQEHPDAPATEVADIAASKQVIDVTPLDTHQPEDDDDVSMSGEPDDQLNSTSVSKELDHDE